MVLDLNKEMAWVTFLDDEWETKWHPVTDVTGKQLEWSDDIMDHCRSQFNISTNWVSHLVLLQLVKCCLKIQ